MRSLDDDTTNASLDTFYSSRRESFKEPNIVTCSIALGDDEDHKECGPFCLGSREFAQDRPPQPSLRRSSNSIAAGYESSTSTTATAMNPIEYPADAPPKPPSKTSSFSDPKESAPAEVPTPHSHHPLQTPPSMNDQSPHLPPRRGSYPAVSTDDTASSVGGESTATPASAQSTASAAYQRLLQGRRRQRRNSTTTTTTTLSGKRKLIMPSTYKSTDATVSDKVKSLIELSSHVVNCASLPEASKLYQRSMDALGKEIKEMNQAMMSKNNQKEQQQQQEWKKQYHWDLKMVGIIIGLLRTKMALLHCEEEEYDTAIQFCNGAIQVHQHQPTLKKEGDDQAGLMMLIVERLEKARGALRQHVELLNKIDMYSQQHEGDFSIDGDDQSSVFSAKEIVFEMISHSAQQDEATVDLLQDEDVLDLLSVHAAEQDKHEQGIKFLNDSLQIHLVALGLKHPHAGESLLRISKMYRGGSGNGRDNEECVLGYFHRTASVLKRSNLGSRERGSVLNDIAVIHMRRGDFTEAIKFLLDALHTYDEDAAEIEKAGRTAAALQVWRNLGECYMQLRKYRSAEGAFLKAMDIQDQSRKIQDAAESLDLSVVGVDEPLLKLISDTSIADTICRIGRARASGGDHAKALDLYKKALGLLHGNAYDENDYLSEAELLAKRDQLTLIFSCIADSCVAVGNPTKAFAMYKLSMKLRSANGADVHDKRSSTLEHCLMCFLGMGDLYTKLNEYDNATKTFREALDYAKANNVNPKFFLVGEISGRLKSAAKTLELGPDRRSEVTLLERRADEEIENGTLDKATETLKELLAIRRTTLKEMKSKGLDTSEQIYSVGCLLQTFGYVFAKNGDDSNAEIAFKDASRLFRKGGVVVDTLVAL